MAGAVRKKGQPCRYCGRPLDPSDPVHGRLWPFCSERCRMAELGTWFDERYVISRPLDQVADDAAPEGPEGGQATPGPEAGRKPPSDPSE